METNKSDTVIDNNVLAFVQSEINSETDWIGLAEIVSSKFSGQEITEAKKILFENVSNIAETSEDVEDILKVFRETDKDELPTYLAWVETPTQAVEANLAMPEVDAVVKPKTRLEMLIEKLGVAQKKYKILKKRYRKLSNAAARAAARRRLAAADFRRRLYEGQGGPATEDS